MYQVIYVQLYWLGESVSNVLEGIYVQHPSAHTSANVAWDLSGLVFFW